jgi:hypothetical protein
LLVSPIECGTMSNRSVLKISNCLSKHLARLIHHEVKLPAMSECDAARDRGYHGSSGSQTSCCTCAARPIALRRSAKSATLRFLEQPAT